MMLAGSTCLLLGTAYGVVQLPLVFGAKLRFAQTAPMVGLVCGALMLSQGNNSGKLLNTMLALKGTGMTWCLCQRLIIVILLGVTIVVNAGFI